MDQEKYDSLSAVRKQQALLQTCVLEKGDAQGVVDEKEESSLEFSEICREYKIDALSEGIELDGNKIEVSKPGASMHISVEHAQDAERYLVFHDLHYQGSRNSEITVTDGKVEKGFVIRSTRDTEYAGIHDVICNLGYRTEQGTEYTLYFSGEGIYTYDSLEMVDQPMGGFGRMTAERGKDPVEYSFGEDELKITAALGEPGIVYVSVPYSKKWKAYADGRRVSCSRANGFGLGICLEAGKHEIVLKY